MSFRGTRVVHHQCDPCVSEPIPMRKPPTGEPCAGEPHARFGGRGRRKPFPTPIGLRSSVGKSTEENKMDIGLLLHTRQIIRQEDAAKSFDHLWSDAAQAEELGFDHIWLGDSVTVLDKARGDCLTTMAALAA